jgi:hypothetical protein
MPARAIDAVMRAALSPLPLPQLGLSTEQKVHQLGAPDVNLREV